MRVHRAGEGAPYTGIKPAGRDLGPAVVAGDKALETGSVKPLAELLTQAVHKSVGGQFKDVIAKKNFKADDVAAGQEYVKAYVGYIHSVERIYEARTAGVRAHGASLQERPLLAAHRSDLRSATIKGEHHEPAKPVEIAHRAGALCRPLVPDLENAGPAFRAG